MFFSQLDVSPPLKAADKQQTASKRMRLCKLKLGLFSNNWKSYQCGFFSVSSREHRRDEIWYNGHPWRNDLIAYKFRYSVWSPKVWCTLKSILIYCSLLLICAKSHWARFCVVSMISEPNTFKCFHYSDRWEHPSDLKSFALRHKAGKLRAYHPTPGYKDLPF